MFPRPSAERMLEIIAEVLPLELVAEHQKSMRGSKVYKDALASGKGKTDMANRRVKLTQAQYTELQKSREWCAHNGLSGLRDFYDEELAFHASRRALPSGAVEYQVPEDEERFRRPAPRIR